MNLFIGRRIYTYIYINRSLSLSIYIYIHICLCMFCVAHISEVARRVVSRDTVENENRPY